METSYCYRVTESKASGTNSRIYVPAVTDGVLVNEQFAVVSGVPVHGRSCCW
jgi:hypothetical protein